MGEAAGEMPDYESLQENTVAAFGDLDASPTKAWVVSHRDEDPQAFDYAVGRRRRFELYDLSRDPHCLQNLAEDPAFAADRERLDQRLRRELRETGDPRVSDEVVFEAPPFTDPNERRR
jgi:uncharacterized sulfatase